MGPVTSDADVLMIDAAERIAAEQGLGAMSLRAVQAAAGQRNKSAAQYHFGSREGLIARITAHRMAPINERRADLLACLPLDAGLAEVVEVLVRPVAEAVFAGDASCWARFVLAGFADPTVAGVVRDGLEGEAFRGVTLRLVDALPPGLDPATKRRRLDQVVGLVFLSLARREREGDPLSVDEFVDDLVAVCVAVLTA